MDLKFHYNEVETYLYSCFHLNYLFWWGIIGVYIGDIWPSSSNFGFTTKLHVRVTPNNPIAMVKLDALNDFDQVQWAPIPGHRKSKELYLYIDFE